MEMKLQGIWKNVEFDEDFLTPMNPLDEKNRKIAALEKELEENASKVEELNSAKEALKEANALLKITRKDLQTSQTKLSFTKNATEQKIIDNISNPDGYREDPILIGVYSATLNEYDFAFGDDTEENRSRKEAFLKSIEDKIDKTNTDYKERILQVKNHVIEKVKATKISRERSRSRSVSSLIRLASKRAHSGDKTDVRST